jgi:uncharacterized cupin superfamily protein
MPKLDRAKLRKKKIKKELRTKNVPRKLENVSQNVYIRKGYEIVLPGQKAKIGKNITLDSKGRLEVTSKGGKKVQLPLGTRVKLGKGQRGEIFIDQKNITDRSRKANLVPIGTTNEKMSTFDLSGRRGAQVKIKRSPTAGSVMIKDVGAKEVTKIEGEAEVADRMGRVNVPIYEDAPGKFGAPKADSRIKYPSSIYNKISDFMATLTAKKHEKKVKVRKKT